MLTEEQFVKQQIGLGRNIHRHDGVYWEQTHKFYCKPAFAYKSFRSGLFRPCPFKSLFGYTHQVSWDEREQANRTMSLMTIEGERLNQFELRNLPSRKRTYIRRFFRSHEIRLIDEIEPHIERVRKINLDQAQRQEGLGSPETPAKRYVEEAQFWRDQIRREFPLYGREWWGAFVNGNLAAYLRTYQVDGIRVIQHVKSHRDLLQHHPVDALYYHILKRSSEDGSCQKIINGAPLHASLNRFKEQFLFRDTKIPYFASRPWILNIGKMTARFMR